MQATQEFIRKVIIPLSFLIGGILLCTVMILLKPKQPPATPKPKASPLVEVAAIEKATKLELYSTGEVVPLREVKLESQVGGEIVFKSPYAKVGNRLEQGMKIFQIDPTDYQINRDQLVEQVEQAKIDISDVQVEQDKVSAQLANAHTTRFLNYRDFDRVLALAKNLKYESLPQDAKSVGERVTNAINTLERSRTTYVSDTVLDQHRQKVLAADDAVTLLTSQVNALKLRSSRLASVLKLKQEMLKKAEVDLSRTTIYAPFSGIVVQESAEQGGYVRPGELLIALDDMTEVEVTCKLRGEQLHWIWGAQPLPATGAIKMKVPHSLGSDSGTSESRPGEHPGEHPGERPLASNDAGAVAGSSRPAAITYQNAPGGLKVSDAAKALLETPPAQPDQDVYALPPLSAIICYASTTKDNSRRHYWKGVLSRYDGSGFHRNTRMAMCRIRVTNPSEVLNALAEEDKEDIEQGKPPTLLNQMFVSVTLEAKATEGMLTIPHEAYKPGNKVWAVRDGKLKFIKVELVDSNEKRVTVFSRELKPEDKLIVSPVASVRDGMPVRVVGKKK